MSSNAICYKNGVKSKTINCVRYLGATPPEEATPSPPPPEEAMPPDIFSFDQRTKNPRSAPVWCIKTMCISLYVSNIFCFIMKIAPLCTYWPGLGGGVPFLIYNIIIQGSRVLILHSFLYYIHVLHVELDSSWEEDSERCGCSAADSGESADDMDERMYMEWPPNFGPEVWDVTREEVNADVNSEYTLPHINTVLQRATQV